MISDASHEGRWLPDSELLFVEDVAKFLDISPAAVRKRIRLGRLGSWMKSGSRYATRRTTFDRFQPEAGKAAIQTLERMLDLDKEDEEPAQVRDADADSRIG